MLFSLFPLLILVKIILIKFNFLHCLSIKRLLFHLLPIISFSLIIALVISRIIFMIPLTLLIIIKIFLFLCGMPLPSWTPKPTLFALHKLIVPVPEPFPCFSILSPLSFLLLSFYLFFYLPKTLFVPIVDYFLYLSCNLTNVGLIETRIEVTVF